MAGRMPQNGQGIIVLFHDFWALLSIFITKFLDLSTPFLKKKDDREKEGGERE